MKITMLGTGNALVTECYNTTFVIHHENKYMLVDGGGGNMLLHQLKKANIDWNHIKEIFVTHKHIDHLLGVIWMVRMICQTMKEGNYEGEAFIYAHEEVIQLITHMVNALLSKKETAFMGKGLHLISVEDGESRTIIGKRTTFFDIGSTKAKQFGFAMELNPGEMLTCCGDEPCSERNYVYAKNSKWLLHEAFCLKSQADLFHPYEKHHSTVADACRLAQDLHVKNLLLYHTEDSDLPNRKERYLAEGQPYFEGRIYIPDDLETIDLT